MQRKDGPVLCSFHQAAVAQGVHRLYHLAFRGRKEEIFPQGLQRERLSFNRQPVHQGLLQRREPLKLLGQEPTETVKRHETFGQKGGDIPAKELAHRLGDDLEGQRIACIPLHQFIPGVVVAREALLL